MTETNDENRNTLNLGQLRLYRVDGESKLSSKPTPKRSMRQLHKLLIIKDDSGLLDGEGSPQERCASHDLPLNNFCRSCVSFRLCEECAVQHEHPTINYPTLEECLQAETQLLDETIEELANRKELLGEQHIALQSISEKVAGSKRNLFARIRRFVDELEAAADLQFNSLLASKRSQIIAYEKTLRKLTTGEPEVLREQLLRTDPVSYNCEPDVLQVHEKCELLLDKLRAFCHTLRSPLVKEVSFSINTLEKTNTSRVAATDQQELATTFKPADTSCAEARPQLKAASSSSKSCHAASLDKFIMKSMTEGQHRQSSHPSSLLRTLNLIGKDPALLGLESQRLRFGEGRTTFFG